MHGAIRDRLEELLRPEREAKSREAEQHLQQCGECSSELNAMRAQSAAFHLLKGPAEPELTASFYAGVLRKIEEKKRGSVWYNLVASPFTSRLVYASLTAAVLLGTFVVGHEARDGHLDTAGLIAQNAHYDAAVYGDQAQQRDAVLANFANH